MAIWQFKLHLFPAESPKRGDYGRLGEIIASDDPETVDWWSDYQPHAGFEDMIDSIFPEIESWAPQVRIWGQDGGNMASVWRDDDGKVEWIEFRLDARAFGEALVCRVSDFAKLLGCVLVTQTGQVLEPEPSLILEAFQGSLAKKFVNDPRGTLRKLKEDDGDK
ncbi:MAG TPA: hypothetical protein VN048_09235 [Verrucomicrobiae bacterium]|jgi:hypothetical protein|nr:hypothetical protein [Verrucomicrobiae bacterium]